MAKTKKERFAEILELPKEVIGGVLKITVYGNSSVVVENHSGISEYRDDFIRLKTPEKSVEIKGCNLGIVMVTDVDVQIEGKIEDIQFL